jgi:hypothetical protein
VVETGNKTGDVGETDVGLTGVLIAVTETSQLAGIDGLELVGMYNIQVGMVGETVVIAVT